MNGRFSTDLRCSSPWAACPLWRHRPTRLKVCHGRGADLDRARRLRPLSTNRKPSVMVASGPDDSGGRLIIFPATGQTLCAEVLIIALRVPLLMRCTRGYPKPRSQGLIHGLHRPALRKFGPTVALDLLV